MRSNDATALTLDWRLTPFSADWYRAYKAEHLRRHPHLVDEPHQNSIRNLDQAIETAELRDAEDGEGR